MIDPSPKFTSSGVTLRNSGSQPQGHVGRIDPLRAQSLATGEPLHLPPRNEPMRADGEV